MLCATDCYNFCYNIQPLHEDDKYQLCDWIISVCPVMNLSTNALFIVDDHWCFSSLDLGGPLLLGSGNVIRDFGYSNLPFSSFIGCMRNVKINGELIDFSRPLLSVDLGPGCGFTGTQCNPNPCSNGGECIGTWGSFICDCRPQFAGTTCKEGTLIIKGKIATEYL